MKRLSTYVLCLLIAVLPGCMNSMSPQQRDAVYETLDSEYRMGHITKKQRDAGREALETANDVGDLASWIYLGGAVLASVLTGVPIAVGVVQKKRGPVATPDERVRRASAVK